MASVYTRYRPAEWTAQYFIRSSSVSDWTPGRESETLEKSTCEYGVSPVDRVVFVFLPVCPSPRGLDPKDPLKRKPGETTPKSLIPCNSALCSHWKIPV